MRAILASNRANLIPMQLRGPIPNGMNDIGCLLALASAVNLQVGRTIIIIEKEKVLHIILYSTYNIYIVIMNKSLSLHRDNGITFQSITVADLGSGS